MPASDWNDDFEDMLEALVETGVEFLVVGAHALAVHGHVRATGDLDVLVMPNPENAKKVMAALRRFGAPVEAHGVNERDFAVPGMVYQIGLPPNRIVILTDISGVTYREAEVGCVMAALGARNVRFIGVEAHSGTNLRRVERRTLPTRKFLLSC